MQNKFTVAAALSKQPLSVKLSGTNNQLCGYKKNETFSDFVFQNVVIEIIAAQLTEFRRQFSHRHLPQYRLLLSRHSR